MTWLAHAGRAVSGVDATAGAAVLAGPGTPAVRSARRINAVLAAVRGMIVHAVAEGGAPGTWSRCCMRSLMTGTFRRRLAGKTPGRGGGCGPGTGCMNR